MTEQAPTMTPLETIDTLFKGLYDELSTASKQVRTLQDSLKGLNREFRNLDRQNKARKKRPQPPLVLSTVLENFLSVEHGTLLTKAVVMKSISAYIKEKNLQVEENKRQFIPNKQLSKIFNLKKPYSMTFVEINKHISHHLTKQAVTESA
jgi:chromatin remodeling complex protein RSC6